MTVTKTGNANAFFERGGTDSALPISAFLQLNGSSELVPATTGQQDAELVDWHNAGAEYECLLTGAPYVIVDVGGGVLTPAASGTAAAILIDDGANGLVASTDLTQTPAGAYYQSVNGSIVAARFDAPRVRLIQSGSTIGSFA